MKIKKLIKNKNEAMVLNRIIYEKEISRSDLSKAVGLSKSSVSEIVLKLIGKSLIYESHIGKSSFSGGRRPIYLKFNATAGSIISIDIRINSIVFILSTLNGEIIDEIEITYQINAPHNFINKLKSNIDFFIKQQPTSPHGIVGIGIAIQGVVLNNQIQFTPNYSLDKIDLYNELKEIYNIPIYLENEANLGALGEYTFSNAYHSLININIDHGVGAGIIRNGEMMIGEHGYIGEMGHSILFPDGKQCSCGNKGCLEQYISIKALLENIENLKNKNLSIDTIIQKAKNGDKEIRNELHQLAKYLSIGINNLVSFHDPEIIIINSVIFNQFPELIEELKNKIKNKDAARVKIKSTNLNRNSSFYGSISLVLQNYLSIDQIKFDNFNNN